jgi:NarL family two-component system response regulator LiaR
MKYIALIDDHQAVANAIGAWLCATGRFAIAGTAATIAQARSLMERLDPLPEIIILDVSLSPSKEGAASKESSPSKEGVASNEGDGLTFIPILKEICAKRKVPLPGIVVFSMYEDLFFVQRAMDLGAAAYVSKSAESGEIVAAIDAILAGKTYISPGCQMSEQERKWPALTPREIEIAALVKQSLNTRQIAGRLGLSIRTVENHLAHIYDKTGISSWEELHDL